MALLWLTRLCKFFASLGAASALLLALLITTSVMGRWIASKPIQGDVELTQLGIAFAISLCLPWCQLQRANIFVDFFTQQFQPDTRLWLDRLGCALLSITCAVLGWRTLVGAHAVFSAGETSMILSLPMWWIYAALAPGLLLTSFVAALQATPFIFSKRS
jgi:TRAP-type C4-dicarboxylate transport system permease small subunit